MKRGSTIYLELLPLEGKALDRRIHKLNRGDLRSLLRHAVATPESEMRDEILSAAMADLTRRFMKCKRLAKKIL